MNKETLTITAPEGHEIDLEESSLKDGVIKFKQIPVKKITKWDQIADISGYWVNNASEIIKQVSILRANNNNLNIFKTREQVESCLAFSMYSQLKEHNDSYEVLCEYLDKSKSMLEILFGDLTEQLIAFVKLIKLRDIVNGDWIPDWYGNSIKYIICYHDKNGFIIDGHYNVCSVLSFETKENANKFLKDNIELLNITKYLI